jgi:hypothetical protein
MREADQPKRREPECGHHNNLPDTHQREFGAQRSHQDIAAAHTYFSSIINSAVLINGGASIALLAFYGNIFKNIIYPGNIIIISSLLFYSIGITCAIMSNIRLREAIIIWSNIWEAVGYRGQTIEYAVTDYLYKSNGKKGKILRAEADRKIKNAEILLASSMAFFVAGTLVSVCSAMFFK